MGGLGSGRLPTKIAVDECRRLEIGELCDSRRWASQPRGEIRWVERGSEVRRASLSYEIAWEEWPPGAPLLIMSVCYRRTPTAPESCDRIILEGGDGSRLVAVCPGCERRVRQLYARPGDDSFCCRACQGLVYRRSARAEKQARWRATWEAQVALEADLPALIGPLLKEPDELDATDAARHAAAQQDDELEALLVRLKDELPLWPQELRVYCLRLARAGLSVRRIAALVDYSKSSVGRYLAAGLQGIDWETLADERRERLRDLRRTPITLTRKGKAMMDHELRRLGHHRPRADDLEERVVIAAPADQADVNTTQTIAPFTDTRLGHQQIAGQPAPELPGALWQRSRLETLRVRQGPGKPTVWQKVVVAIEASPSAAQESGVIVAALGFDGQVYLLADHSGHYPAERWAALVLSLCESRKAACVATGRNDAGKLVTIWLRHLDDSVSVELKRLTYDGELPAAPVSLLYVQDRVHHIGVFPALEDQMVSFTARRKRGAQDPPTRVAALVWALTELVVGNQPQRAKGVWPPGRF
jgi:hypothetical protein